MLGRENVRLETRRAYRRWCRVGYLSQCPVFGYWISNAYCVMKPNSTPVCLWKRLGYSWHAFGAWEAASPSWHWTPVCYSPYCSSRCCCNWAVLLSLPVPASLSSSYHQALTRLLPALAGAPQHTHTDLIQLCHQLQEHKGSGTCPLLPSRAGQMWTLSRRGKNAGLWAIRSCFFLDFFFGAWKQLITTCKEMNLAAFQ